VRFPFTSTSTEIGRQCPVPFCFGVCGMKSSSNNDKPQDDTKASAVEKFTTGALEYQSPDFILIDVELPINSPKALQ